jgi:hypothetical protein
LRWGSSARSGSCETLRETAKSHGRTPNARVRTRPRPLTTSVPNPLLRRSDLKLASSAERGLSGLLAEAVDGHLATFAEHVAEGLLAASTAVGLEPRALQHVPAMDLVIQRVEPSPGVGLGRPVQRSLQFSDLVVPGGTSHEGTHQPFPVRDAQTKQRPFPHRRLCCPLGSTSTTAASDAHPARHPLPGGSRS